MADKSVKRKLWLLALMFGILMTVPFIVPHCGPIALFSFVPLFLMEDIIAKNNIRHRFLYFYIAFLIFNIGATFWVWCVSPAGAVAALGLNALQMAVIFYIFSFIKKHLSQKYLAYFAFAVIWLAWEHVYFNIEISWPWLVLGNAFATSPYLVQWYEITGSLGGSLWILASGILVFQFISTKKAKYISVAGCLIILPVVASIIRYNNYKEEENPVEVLAIQPNIDPFMKYGVSPQRDIDLRFIELAAANITPDTKYIISPETFTYGINLDSPQENASYRIFNSFLAEHQDITMILGALTEKVYTTGYKPTKSARKANRFWYDFFNSAITMDNTGIIDYYHKSKLVPGVEIIPYQNVLKFLGRIVEKFGGSSESYGTMDEMQPLLGKDGHKSGVMICYESIYGDYSRVAAKKGADFLAIITNDGWWGDTPGYRQHFRYAGLRAIEMRRDVVQVADTGISGFINQKGQVKSRTGWWEETTLTDTINTNSTITFFTEHGDFIGRCACWMMIMVTGLFVSAIIIKRNRTQSPPVCPTRQDVLH